MTNEEMVDLVTTLVGDDRLAQLVPAYVKLAKDAVLNHVYPYMDDAVWDDVPEKHHVRTCEIAVYLVNRRGAEGETMHSENSVSHSYESAGIPNSYFDGIIPFAGVPR